MIIITAIIIIIGVVLSIDNFNKKEVKKALKTATATIFISIASNIIWIGVSPLLDHNDIQLDDQLSNSYTDRSPNSDDAQQANGLQNGQMEEQSSSSNTDKPQISDDTQRTDELQNDDVQDTSGLIYKDDVSETEEVLINGGSPNDSGANIQTVPELRVYNVADSKENKYDNPSFPKSEVDNTNVSFLNYSGSINESNQENSYEFYAPESGKYRCELADMISGFTLSIYLYDANGSRIDYNIGISNGSGLNMELSAGNLYRLVVKSCTGTGSYSLFVGQQKEIMNISNCTTVNDSIEFISQENKYLYTPTVTGVHRFWISQINSGVRVSIYVYDEAGYKVGDDFNIGIGNGVTVTLTAGQTYSVIIKQTTGCGSYALSIGPQKPTLDISAYTAISDSTEFAGQSNSYLYTASASGIHRFQIEQINSGIRVSMYVYDAAGYRLGYNTNSGQGSGVTVTLDKDETYSIVVKQTTGYDSYTMSIGSPKEVVNISGYDVVNDNIQFYEQENIYTYTPTASGSYKLSLGNMVSGVKISVYIYDDANYRVNYATGMSNANYFSTFLEANRTYVIKAKHSSNYGSYSLTINLESK